MNYHFTTAKAHITTMGGSIEELIIDEGLRVTSDNLFKGNMDIDKLKAAIKRLGKENISFVRLEAGTNLVGGQPVSMGNIRQISQICKAEGLTFVFDASLLSDNLYFIKVRDPQYKDVDVKEITREIGSLVDVMYFSARKLGAARGGGILTSNKDLFLRMRELIPLYEGFLTYGGMLDEAMDFQMINQGPIFIEYMVGELVKRGIPVITPAGGLGVHLDALQFIDHVPQSSYAAAALGAAMYIAGGVRGMERGTISEEREPDGSEHFSNMELQRLALPRRVFTLSQVKYMIDRVTWL
jgi:tryptophanase